MRLDGRTALITGASRGIGRAIAVAFAQEGARLALTGRDTAELDALSAELTALGTAHVIVPVDLARREAVDELGASLPSEFQAVDILVNNAGIGSSASPRPVVDYDDDFWELSLYVNLTVPYRLTRKVLPGMIERGHGRLINIASINSKVPSLHGAAYTASKHGLLGLTRAVALETARQGVTANAICPGPTRTLMNNRRIAYDAQRLGLTPEQFEANMTPMGRRLDPREIAVFAVYLASDDAAGVTGQSFNIDGGVLMS